MDLPYSTVYKIYSVNFDFALDAVRESSYFYTYGSRSGHRGQVFMLHLVTRSPTSGDLSFTYSVSQVFMLVVVRIV